MRVAIEIDGIQHLSSKEAYRTDRRKDLLLQEHGYIVFRFLASDVSKRLDVVLDTILRVLYNMSRHPGFCPALHTLTLLCYIFSW